MKRILAIITDKKPKPNQTNKQKNLKKTNDKKKQPNQSLFR